MEFLGYKVPEDFICEITGAQAVDLHHIIPRGMGGSKTKDAIENVMALTRQEHEKAELGIYTKEELIKIHYDFIERQTGIRLTGDLGVL